MNGNIDTSCARCHKAFRYDVHDMLDQRGVRTRRYCDTCIVLQHRDEKKWTWGCERNARS